MFDLDGVLIDSTRCHRAAFEEVLRPFGIDDFDYSKYAGWRTAEVIAAEFIRGGIGAAGATISAAAENKTILARRKLAETKPVATGSREALEQLSARYLLGLASSGSRGSVDAFLEWTGFRRYFRSVLAGDDVARAKPDPEIYLKSFASLGLAPEECVVVEDAVSGIDAGRRAGAEVIAVAGTCSAGALLAAGASRTVETLQELIAVYA